MELEVVQSLDTIPAEAWDALTRPNDPFTRHGFLSLLERSRSVGPPRTGWQPVHLVAREGSAVVGAMPLYLKQHSYGEFIFDFGWANAAGRAGIAYYPKLVSAVPMTPAGGARLLVHPETDQKAVYEALVRGALSLMRATSASSLHVLFCTAEEAEALAAFGLHHRHSVQYHFDNPGAQNFEELSGFLRSPSRKQVRNERRKAQEHGLALTMRPFSALSTDDIDAMWEFYLSTIDRHGAEPYLTRAFFEGLVHDPHAYAAMAHRDRHAVAGSLFFQCGNALYGRYWGTREDLPMLHFELCYYFPLAWALPRGISHVEAGAQGEHKIKRGFLPQLCHSAHIAAHPGLDRAIADFVVQEARHVAELQAELAESTPFKRE